MIPTFTFSFAAYPRTTPDGRTKNVPNAIDDPTNRRRVILLRLMPLLPCLIRAAPVLHRWIHPPPARVAPSRSMPFQAVAPAPLSQLPPPSFHRISFDKLTIVLKPFIPTAAVKVD